MNKVLAFARTATFGAVIAFTTAAAAQVFTKPPNLKPLPAFNVSLLKDSVGDEWLRFSTTSWNSGTGPLQLEGGPVTTGAELCRLVHLPSRPRSHPFRRLRAVHAAAGQRARRVVADRTEDDLLRDGHDESRHHVARRAAG